MTSDCFICTKQGSGDAFGCGVIYEDELVFASHIVASQDGKAYLGHVFVETRRHVSGFGQLTDAEAAAVGILANDLAAALQATEGAEHVYSFVYGDAVPHLHVHLQPRYPNTPAQFRPRRDGNAVVVALADWPDAPRGDVEAIRAVTTRLHDEVARIRSERAAGPG